MNIISAAAKPIQRKSVPSNGELLGAWTSSDRLSDVSWLAEPMFGTGVPLLNCLGPGGSGYDFVAEIWSVDVAGGYGGWADSESDPRASATDWGVSPVETSASLCA
jgi:hypothetical protein